jgi:hypothetical protein
LIITISRLTRFKVIYVCVRVKKQSCVFLKYLFDGTKHRPLSNGVTNALAVKSALQNQSKAAETRGSTGRSTRATIAQHNTPTADHYTKPYASRAAAAPTRVCRLLE